MKEFQSLRTELNEGIEDLQEHIAIANSSMPPNILILRRKTVRQFPNNTMVALYYNDKLGQYFSIPYGGDAGGVVTPVALKEAEEILEGAYSKHYGFEHNSKVNARSQWLAKFEDHVIKAKPEHAGKIDWDTAHYFHNQGHKPEDAATLYNTRRRDRLEEEHTPGDTVRYLSGSNAHLKVGKVVSQHPEHVVVSRGGFKYKVNRTHIVHNDRTGRVATSDLKEEPLNELSKGFLASYIRGAARNKDLLMVKSGNQRMVGNDKEAEKYQVKSFKRTKGIRTAAEKLANKGPRSLEEGAIEHLKQVRSFGTGKPLKHADGTQTRIDPTTAHALLTVHDALKPEHQVKFVQHLEHSKPKFHKMLDFAWSQVK